MVRKPFSRAHKTLNTIWVMWWPLFFARWTPKLLKCVTWLPAKRGCTINNFSPRTSSCNTEKKAKTVKNRSRRFRDMFVCKLAKDFCQNYTPYFFKEPIFKRAKRFTSSTYSIIFCWQKCTSGKRAPFLRFSRKILLCYLVDLCVRIVLLFVKNTTSVVNKLVKNQQ